MRLFLRTASLSFAACLGLSACASSLPSHQNTKKSASETSPRARQPGADMPAVALLPPERVMRDGLHGPEAPGPDRLIGLKAGQIQSMLGHPDFKRHDPPAEIWQYRKNTCMLDIFLYETGTAAGEYRVKYVDTRGHSVNAVSGTDCLLEAIAK